jgi:hypothetical protein
MRVRYSTLRKMPRHTTARRREESVHPPTHAMTFINTSTILSSHLPLLFSPILVPPILVPPILVPPIQQPSSLTPSTTSRRLRTARIKMVRRCAHPVTTQCSLADAPSVLCPPITGPPLWLPSQPPRHCRLRQPSHSGHAPPHFVSTLRDRRAGDLQEGVSRLQDDWRSLPWRAQEPAEWQARACARQEARG